jgi:hypothetical protein
MEKSPHHRLASRPAYRGKPVLRTGNAPPTGGYFDSGAYSTSGNGDTRFAPALLCRYTPNRT